jgi:DNA-binding NarL/FixJ family response regulator
MIRVAIVADSPVVRAGLVAVLSAEPDIQVDAGDGEQSMPAIMVGESVDVLIWAPRGSVTRADMTWHDDSDIDEHVMTPPTMVLLEGVDIGAVRHAYAAGANAVFPFDARSEELVAALRAVASGLVVVQPALSAELMDASRLTHSSGNAASVTTPLTPREREVLALLAQGLANKVIASRLGITEHTVKTHVAAVYEKLGAGNRAEAVVAAARRGLIML